MRKDTLYERYAIEPTTSGELIRVARIKARMTQKQLAIKSNLSPESISNIEIHGSPNITSVRVLSDALGLPIWYLGKYDNLPESTLEKKGLV